MIRRTILAVVLLAAPGHAQVGKLRPVDEAARAPGFVQFRKKLLAAVARQDAAFVVSILDPKIRNSFGGDDGIAEFKEMWRPEKRGSELWATLGRALKLGGTWDASNGQFWAPYVFKAFPDAIDFWTGLAVVRPSVVARKAPSVRARGLATLSYDIVTEAEGHEAPGWTAIRLKDGRLAWVPADSVYSPVGYRAGFVRVGGNWKLRWFIAGD